jgi:hypothetical protein
MKVFIPQIPIQKSGFRTTDEDLLMNLSASPQYGTFFQKFTDYHERHVYMNELLCDIYLLHTMERPMMVAGGKQVSIKSWRNKIIFSTETLIYWMRKNIDEFIGFNYYAYYVKQNKKEPESLEIHSIGMLLKDKFHYLYSRFSEHIGNLQTINDISNTFKHSFVTSEAHMLIGKDEPVVNCLEMKHNKTKNAPVFHSYFLKDVVQMYIQFFVDARAELKTFRGIE